MNNRKTILAVIPAYNEEGKIGRVLSKIPPGILDEVVVVDDCSSDNTSEEAKAHGAVVIRHSRNRGVGAGIRSGIEYGIERGFDIIVVLSGDDQHKPSEIPRVVGPIIEEDCDFVQGSRYLQGERTENMTGMKRLLTRVYPLVFRLCTGFPSTDVTNGFRAFTTSAITRKEFDLRQDWLDGYELEPYLLYKAVTGGLRVREVPITIVYHKEKAQNTKMRSLRDWWRIFRPLVFLRLGLKR